ncbi:hypothetical protein [Leptotrichia sp. OH3620_COT-345]|uniref:hypothetical protein n=1 Tax=Leptotrichia sp. OH3620_COT-345 TaxID=2491048 RepID=UPI0013159C3C|nr:hypothetical protein [Leptotrichia sp. OH3620_COT-345]
MKRLMLIVVMLMAVLSCTAEDIEIWNRVDRRMKERGHGCYRDPYYGNIKCGYRR